MLGTAQPCGAITAFSVPFDEPPINSRTTLSPLEALLEEAEQAFVALHGHSPEQVVAAPGRVNLIGEHIDYNDGFVLPMAIERYVVIAAARRDPAAGRLATFHSTQLQQSHEIPLDGSLTAPSGGWISYVEGVVAGFSAQHDGIPALDAVIHSNVPLGGGLSSSAALEVATATLLESLSGHVLPPIEKAMLCQAAEHRFAGVPCGIMDQFSSVFGKPDELMLLDCRSQQIQPVPFATDAVTVLVMNSNVKHALNGGEYAERRAACDTALGKLQQTSWRDVTAKQLESSRAKLTAVEYQRARHVVSEIDRTQQAALALTRDDWETFGQLMFASHQSLRDDYEVSCTELDILVKLASEIGAPGGVLGSRMTGGGFGGCTVTLVRQDCVPAVQERLTAKYLQQTGITASGFASRPARGAHRIGG